LVRRPRHKGRVSGPRASYPPQGGHWLGASQRCCW
jgi:hypothetical protein